MKNLIFACICLCFTASLFGQYFQKTYGSTVVERLYSGVNTASPQGHLMTGEHTGPNGEYSLVAIQTNLDGNITSPRPYYNNKYRLYETGSFISAHGKRIIQPSFFPDGDACIWGDCGISTPATKFFYTVIDTNGLPLVIKSYAFPGAVEAIATSMCYTADSTIYACGFILKTQNGPHFPVVVCIDATTGTLLWGKEYEPVGTDGDWLAMDIEKDPNDTVLAIVGSYTPSGAPEEGSFFRVGIKSGVAIYKMTTYGTLSNYGAFTSIEISNNPLSNGVGFVMGGYYNNPNSASDDSWVIKASPDGRVIDFSSLIGYSTGTTDRSYDIIERVNNLPANHNNYEYYVVGTVQSGPFGNQDIFVYKLDSMGIPVTSGQFVYGGSGIDHGIQLDHNDNGGANNNGLSIFGNSWSPFALGNVDFYFIKSYYNGVTACDYTLLTPWWQSGPGVLDSVSYTSNSLTSGDLTIDVSSLEVNPICFESSIPEGNNERMAPVQVMTELVQPGFFPNPVSLDNPVITLLLGQATKSGICEIELMNSLGQQCWTQTIQLIDGQPSMEIDLGHQLDCGIYHLILKRKNSKTSYKIVLTR